MTAAVGIVLVVVLVAAIRWLPADEPTDYELGRNR